MRGHFELHESCWHTSLHQSLLTACGLTLGAAHQKVEVLILVVSLGQAQGLVSGTVDVGLEGMTAPFQLEDQHIPFVSHTVDEQREMYQAAVVLPFYQNGNSTMYGVLAVDSGFGVNSKFLEELVQLDSIAQETDVLVSSTVLQCNLELSVAI